jgi:hypothetical protein
MAKDRRMLMVRKFYGRVMMSPFPYMKDSEIKAILDYVDTFPYDSLSPAYEHRRYTIAQQDSILNTPD